MSKNISSCTYYVSGTHCRSCELLIEKEIGDLPGIKSVSASSTKGTVNIKYKPGHLPVVEKLNQIFKSSNYTFSKNPTVVKDPNWLNNFFISGSIILLLFFAYFLLNSLGIFSSITVNSDSYLPAFFLFGLAAGFSTCAALVGGLVLSFSRFWSKYKLIPVLSFNFGRVILFGILGAFLGLLGSYFRLSVTTGAIITILVAILMLILGLQMLGVKALSSFQISLPKSITGKIVDQDNFQGKFMPFIIGGLTFFLPCGFTLTTQSLALASGSWTQGALIMMFFALGTFIPLFLIGLGGIKSQGKSQASQIFSQTAAMLVVIFALLTLKNQINVLGISPFSGSSNTPTVDQSDLVPETNGVQIIRMDASSSGYSPNYFKIKAGLLVRWEITDRGTSGCTNAVISRSLFSGAINLVPGTTSVKEFTAPATPGTYRFSCWMGMISGTIEVVN